MSMTVSFVAPFFGGGTLDEVIQREREKTAEVATIRPSERKPEIAAESSQTPLDIFISHQNAKVTHDVLEQSRKKAASDVLAHIQKAVTMTDIKKELESCLRGEGINWWTQSQDDGKKKDKCEICCVNKPEKTFVNLPHDRSCRSKIQMCVGCLWNWRYNPVKCHSCNQEKIQSPVGDHWGAILIAGTDEKEEGITKRFEDDIEKLMDRGQCSHSEEI
ncbi:hypothetical protein MAR_002689 [Mya arenaria]|uniref:RING-type domain-containing protein n=1 Tax=Mya arenaria TaxID=6604 RepID=A0ABY7G7U3_MYAAR|nr:hypothetical protein MAR_002689 [Mya arenaria]